MVVKITKTMICVHFKCNMKERKSEREDVRSKFRIFKEQFI